MRLWLRAWGRHEDSATRNPLASTGKSGCIWPDTWADGWSTTAIGRFYNGRDHSTVCYGIQRIEALRESDPDVDALITDLKHELSAGGDSRVVKSGTEPHSCVSLSRCDLQALAGLIADRLYARMGRMPHPEKGHSDDNGLAG